MIHVMCPRHQHSDSNEWAGKMYCTVAASKLNTCVQTGYSCPSEQSKKTLT
jgi:hypothetical protein